MVHCFFCKNDKGVICSKVCDFYICIACWNRLPDYVSSKQKWELVKKRGEKLIETLQ